MHSTRLEIWVEDEGLAVQSHDWLDFFVYVCVWQIVFSISDAIETPREKILELPWARSWIWGRRWMNREKQGWHFARGWSGKGDEKTAWERRKMAAGLLDWTIIRVSCVQKRFISEGNKHAVHDRLVKFYEPLSARLSLCVLCSYG